MINCCPGGCIQIKPYLLQTLVKFRTLSEVGCEEKVVDPWLLGAVYFKFNV